MSEKENIKVAEQALAALNAHDVNKYVQLIDDSYVGEAELGPGPIHGREGARQRIGMLLTAFPDLRVEVEQILASGDHVVSRVRLTGTQKGNYAGVAPTNKSVSWQGCTVTEIRNGKAIRSRIYADNASLLQQIGALSLPKTTTA
ncbi:MAG: ester cyclase [Bryobacteraceae bacterium]